MLSSEYLTIKGERTWKTSINVLIITQGFDAAVKFASKFVSGPKVHELLQNGGVTALNTYLTEQITGRITGAIPKPGQPV